MKYPILLALFLLCNSLVFSQEEKVSNIREDAIKVFIDCNFCDMDYIRKKINYVNYVRDSKEAQVHVLITSQRTGSGGVEYTFNFIGQLDFEGQNDTISTIANTDATSDEKRELRSKFILIGLMRYIAKTPLVDYITIDYTKDSEEEEVTDKWNSWVYNIGGDGWFSGEEAYKSKNISGFLTANRITEKWKFENYLSIGFSEDNFKIDESTNYTSSSESYQIYSSAVFGISDHWSTGMIMSVNSSTYSNIELGININPAIEYNIFKYSESTSKQIRLQYRVGYYDFQYRDTTIYNMIHDNAFKHNLSIAAEFNQKWGAFSLSATGSQYLYDTSLNNLTFYGNLSWRIIKGLSLTTHGRIQLIHDQISLPKGGASDVDILLQQKQLATQYSYWLSVGISYTFGSIYNNVVNPRFGN